MNGYGSPSARHMPDTSPFDILADEFGAVAGRIEREVNLRVSAAIADLTRRDAERELLLTKLMQDINERVTAKLETVRNGVDGIAGKDGVDGAHGRDGVDGAPGIDGKDGVNGADGQAGADGLPGNDGRDGIDGKDGINGADGAAGLDGKDGISGKDGLNGKDGEPGIAGRDGKDGISGKDGIDGLNGKDGERGPAGKLPKVKSWTEGVHYDGEVVVHKGALYQAERDTGKEPDTSDDWTCLAARGSDGKDGRGFTIKGTYSPDKKYEEHDVVACNSGSFVALKDGAGACPGPDWQLFSGPGKRGDKGLPGDRGEPGKEGKQGPAGPTISEWIRDGYSVVPLMSDGTAGPALDVREFFELYHREAV